MGFEHLPGGKKNATSGLWHWLSLASHVHEISESFMNFSSCGLLCSTLVCVTNPGKSKAWETTHQDKRPTNEPQNMPLQTSCLFAILKNPAKNIKNQSCCCAKVSLDIYAVNARLRTKRSCCNWLCDGVLNDNGISEPQDSRLLFWKKNCKFQIKQTSQTSTLATSYILHQLSSGISSG